MHETRLNPCMTCCRHFPFQGEGASARKVGESVGIAVSGTLSESLAGASILFPRPGNLQHRNTSPEAGPSTEAASTKVQSTNVQLIASGAGPTILESQRRTDDQSWQEDRIPGG